MELTSREWSRLFGMGNQFGRGNLTFFIKIINNYKIFIMKITILNKLSSTKVEQIKIFYE